jgi:hypothetical protein
MSSQFTKCKTGHETTEHKKRSIKLVTSCNKEGMRNFTISASSCRYVLPRILHNARYLRMRTVLWPYELYAAWQTPLTRFLMSTGEGGRRCVIRHRYNWERLGVLMSQRDILTYNPLGRKTKNCTSRKAEKQVTSTE